MAPIPIALCGKNPNMAASFTDHPSLSPDYYIAHVFHTPQTVATELPSLLSGKHTPPSSQLGTNASASQTTAPRAIVVGAGFSRQELDSMRALEGCGALPWLYPDASKMARTGLGVVVGKDFMTSVVERAVSVLKENGLGKEEAGKGEGGVWGF